MTDKNIIDWDSMTQAEAIVSEKIQNLQKVQNEAIGIVSSLEAAWTGDSAGAFNRALDKWIQDFGTCIKELNLIEEKLGGNKKVYVNNESQQNQHVAQLLAQIEA